MENKAHSLQIKELQTDLITSGTKPTNFQATKKLLEEKEKTIQFLQKKLKVPVAQHVQLSKLTVLQQEKDKIYQELMEFKGKMLNLSKDKDAYEIERSVFVSHMSSLPIEKYKRKCWRS